MSNYRDKFSLYVGLSLTLHVAMIASLTMLPPMRAVPAEQAVQRFALLPPGIDPGQAPGGAPLGRPAPAPAGRPAKKAAAARITSPSLAEPSHPPTEIQPTHVEQSRPPATTSDVPAGIAPSFSTPAPDNGAAQGGSETGATGSNGEGGAGAGGTGEGGSPDGCIGCRGGLRGHGSGTRAASDWKADYRKKVFARIQRAKQYPYAARRAGMEGRVVVKFIISRTGAISALSVVTPSSYPILNSDALDWVQRACPFPPFPADAEESSMAFTYGLRYELTE